MSSASLRPAAPPPARRRRALRPRAAAAAASAAEPPLPFALRELDVPLDAASARAVRLLLPSSEDEVLDAFITAGRQEADPFFGSVWPASLALARRLAARPQLARGRRVLDAGCGLGLVALAAALGGAAVCAAADAEPLALACVRRSAAANGLRLASEAQLRAALARGAL